MEDNGGILSFLAEFSAFEDQSVAMALRSFSGNDSFADTAERVLDLNARLRLVRRMAFVRNLDSGVCEEINQIEERAARLAARRDEIVAASRYASKSPISRELITAKNEAAGVSRKERELLKSGWTPTVAEIDECRKETQHIRHSLADIIKRMSAEQRHEP